MNGHDGACDAGRKPALPLTDSRGRVAHERLGRG